MKGKATAYTSLKNNREPYAQQLNSRPSKLIMP